MGERPPAALTFKPATNPNAMLRLRLQISKVIADQTTPMKATFATSQGEKLPTLPGTGYGASLATECVPGSS